MSDSLRDQYAILWFEDSNMFTLVDDEDKTIILDRHSALEESARILDTESEINEAEEGIRYAVPAYLLDELFGWTV